MPFFTFTLVRQTCFAYNFFLVHFLQLFNGFEISVKFCVSDIFFYFFQKKIFGVILALFENFEAKPAKNGSKIKKRI
jgi:hypothetical protein